MPLRYQIVNKGGGSKIPHFMPPTLYVFTSSLTLPPSFFLHFSGLNDQDVISLGNHTEEAVKDKRRLFMYRVVAPQGLFPGILIDHLTIYIIRLTLNTECNAKYLSSLHTQMKYFLVHPLVCPYITWPREGFYVDPFLIDAFPSE